MNAKHDRPARDRQILDRQLRAIRKLGISGFETTDEVGTRQADLLKRLKLSAWFGKLRAQLRRCTADQCGKRGCAEVCAFGNWRRRRALIYAACQLITDAPA